MQVNEEIELESFFRNPIWQLLTDMRNHDKTAAKMNHKPVQRKVVRLSGNFKTPLQSDILRGISLKVAIY